jgi:type VI secretion system secreted protein Hcp
MAVDMFLKIDGIQGESRDSKHKGEIEILSFSWGVSNSGSGQTGGGGGAGKVTVHDFSIVKQLDTTSPELLERACRGEHLGSALLTLVRTGSGKSDQQEYLKIKLSDILISGYSTGGSNTTLPAEQVTFTFQTADVAAADGNGGWKSGGTCGTGAKF